MHHHMHPWTVSSLFCCHYLSGCLSKMAALPICLSSPSASKRQVTWLSFPCPVCCKSRPCFSVWSPTQSGSCSKWTGPLKPQSCFSPCSEHYRCRTESCTENKQSLPLLWDIMCPSDNSKSPWIPKAFNWVQSSQELGHFVFSSLCPTSHAVQSRQRFCRSQISLLR